MRRPSRLAMNHILNRGARPVAACSSLPVLVVSPVRRSWRKRWSWLYIAPLHATRSLAPAWLNSPVGTFEYLAFLLFKRLFVRGGISDLGSRMSGFPAEAGSTPKLPGKGFLFCFKKHMANGSKLHRWMCGSLRNMGTGYAILKCLSSYFCAACIAFRIALRSHTISQLKFGVPYSQPIRVCSGGGNWGHKCLSIDSGS
jgi:hypothetical protein